MAKFEVKKQNGKAIFLKDQDEIQRGGEGRIILMPAKTGLVAKIYHQGIAGIDETRFNQLQNLDKEIFVKPIDLLFQADKIVGYTMEYAGKEFFPLSALFNQNFILRNAIDDNFRKKIAEKLILAIKSAHHAGFVIGDLNQFNVLLRMNGDIKFIDVDSYQTPGYQHSGILLDDIRDYYYHGNVNMNSDYFALSILLFSLFTFTHPFKGIHQKYRILAERMINRIPIFLDDPLLKVPKCYQGIGNQAIQDDFNKLYIEGQRFLMTMHDFTTQRPVTKPQLKNSVAVSDISIQTIIDSNRINNVYFNQNIGYIETQESFIIYDAQIRQHVKKIIELKKQDYDQVFLGNNNLLARKKEQLFLIQKSGNPVEIQNFKIPGDGFFYQLSDILIVLGHGQMYWLYLDEVYNASIRNKRIEVFSEAFTHHSGLIQNTGGIQRIFYNTGKDIASVKLGKPVKKIFQQAQTGIVQYIDGAEIVNQYYKISGLNIEFINVKPESFIEYGFKMENKEQGFLFEPGDNKIYIRRMADFEIVSEISCNVISRQTPIFYSKAGLILWEKDSVFLVNTKK